MSFSVQSNIHNCAAQRGLLGQRPGAGSGLHPGSVSHLQPLGLQAWRWPRGSPPPAPGSTWDLESLHFSLSPKGPTQICEKCSETTKLNKVLHGNSHRPLQEPIPSPMRTVSQFTTFIHPGGAHSYFPPGSRSPCHILNWHLKSCLQQHWMESSRWNTKSFLFLKKSSLIKSYTINVFRGTPLVVMCPYSGKLLKVTRYFLNPERHLQCISEWKEQIGEQYIQYDPVFEYAYILAFA